MGTTSSYMHKAMLEKVDQECGMLQRATDNSNENLYLKCLALIIVSRLRVFLRGKSELEIYTATKGVKSLNKLRANERHTVASFVVKYL